MNTQKAKHIFIMFFGAGAWGIGMSLFLNNSFLLFLAGINLALAIIFLTAYKRSKHKRKD